MQDANMEKILFELSKEIEDSNKNINFMKKEISKL